jgi:hypothetical protein
VPEFAFCEEDIAALVPYQNIRLTFGIKRLAGGLPLIMAVELQ